MEKICVVGTGYVGLVTAVVYAELGHQVIGVDIDVSKVDSLNKGVPTIFEDGLEELLKKGLDRGILSFTSDIKKAIQSSEIIYIAVGTPSKEDGSANLQYVQNVAYSIGEFINSDKIVVNKSTVPVGTGEKVLSWINEKQNNSYKVDIVSNPEFLRQGTAIYDTFNMERAIIGSSSKEAATRIASLHSPFNCEIVITDLQTAEMIKYAANTFLAMKISFINEMANLCELVGANIDDLSKGIGLDKRISPHFLNAGIGYGGSCFPKDTAALVQTANEYGYSMEIVKSVINVNEKQKSIVTEKLDKIYSDLNGKKVSVLGLSFKPNTDDLRDAPSISVIPKLVEKGANVVAYDPIAMDNAKKIFNDSIIYANKIEDAITDSEVVVILTEWDEFKKLNLEDLKMKMKKPIIIDGRNIFNPEVMESIGFIYYSIGRKQIEELILF